MGFNKPGATLPAKLSWEVTEEAHKDLLEEINTDFDILPNESTYIFVNKTLMTQLVNDGKITNADLTAIKTVLQNGGIDYDTLPDKYEKYTLGEMESMRSWEWT